MEQMMGKSSLASIDPEPACPGRPGSARKASYSIWGSSAVWRGLSRLSCAVCLTAALSPALGGARLMASELDLLPLGDPDRAFEIVSGAPGATFDCRVGKQVSFEDLIDSLAASHVVLLGEEHTSMDQKLEHARIVEALAARGVPLVLGMEFFLRGDRESLEAWGAGRLDEEGLLRETGWYDRGTYRFDFYRPVMEVARKSGIPVVGINVPRSILRSINRGGMESLSDEQRAQIGPVETAGSPAHRYLISRYLGETVAMLPPQWFDNMYAAQCTWDVVMARSILADLPENGIMVVIVGSGHVAYDLGIPRRLAEERVARGLEPLDVAVYCPASAPAPDPGDEPGGHPMARGMMGGAGEKPARFARSLADFVRVFPAPGPSLFPTLGLRFKESSDGEAAPEVMMAFPDSAAASVGLGGGDRIVSLDGEPVGGLSQLRWSLARLEWGQRIELGINRGEDHLDVGLLLYPELVETELNVAPGWTVSVDPELDPATFDPLSDESLGIVAQANDRDDGDRPEAVLVGQAGRPVRLELRGGGRLDEVHELDAEGRVVRSLFREPRTDGVTELVLERNAAGEVVSVQRTGASEKMLSR